ncbi:hypothetical protein Cus16_2029 [Curtobacterium sp. ER1/6]|nr:hypothetical protein Cus16_2029 [Curtobacterium sp. ER1/6]
MGGVECVDAVNETIDPTESIQMRIDLRPKPAPHRFQQVHHVSLRTGFPNPKEFGQQCAPSCRMIGGGFRQDLVD